MSTESTNSQQARFVFSFTGNGVDMAILMLKNIFLTIITLGIYHAWAKTNMRRYLWENIAFMDDSGTYVGTGGELFRGWIKLFGILIVFLMGMFILEKLIPFFGVIRAFGLPVLYAVVFAVATYAGLGYRLSRTLWRHIRFGIDKDKESTKEFIILYLKGALFSVLSFGIYYPIFRNQTRHFLLNKTRLGKEYFKFDGQDVAYLKLCLKGFFLSIFTLGLYVPWFMAAALKYRLKHTQFQQARFDFSMSGKDAFLCGIGAYVGVILSFGLAAPWLYVWILRKVAQNISVEGALDLSSIQQQASDGSALAEDVMDEYDLDFGL